MSAAKSDGSISRVDHAREMTTQAIATLDEQLAAGNSTQLDAFLKALSRFHTYSFGNVMLIMVQKPEATRVAGFHTWRSLGRTVRKGEKGILIIAPMVLRIQNADEPDASQAPVAEGAQKSTRSRLRFRAAYVFDISQTDGDPLPEPARVGGDPGPALDRLEAAVVASGITLETSDTLIGVEGYSAGGRIVLRHGQESAERFSTLVHEWAHELLHQSDRENRPPKTVRETEAEAVAYIVGHAVGLDLGTASADYIRLYQGTSETLSASLDRIQKTACHIIEAIAEDQAERPARDRTHETAAVMQKGRVR